jgi:hypothetical protein
MPIRLTRAEVLRAGARLRERAVAQVVDANAAYLLVHDVMAETFSADAKSVSVTTLDASLMRKVESYFNPTPHAEAPAP